MSGVGNAPLLSKSNSLTGGVNCFAGLYFDENNHLPFADNQVDFTNFAAPVGFKDIVALFHEVSLCSGFTALTDEIVDLCMPGFHGPFPSITRLFGELAPFDTRHAWVGSILLRPLRLHF